MMNKSAFVRHMQIVSEAYAACDKICDCLGVQDMDNGLIDLLNDSSLVYADMFKVDIDNEDDFHDAFWEIAECGECQRLGLASWEDFYDRFSGETPDYGVWEGTPTRQ